MRAALHFPLLGEPVSLDLVNTRIRHGGADVDLLDTPSALTTWLAAESGRLSWSGVVTAADLRAVRALRDAIAALLRARRVRARPPAGAMKVVNAALSASAPLASRHAAARPGPGCRQHPDWSGCDTRAHMRTPGLCAAVPRPPSAPAVVFGYRVW